MVSGEHGAGHRHAIGVGVKAQALHTKTMDCAGLVAFQWAATAIADFSTNDRVGITSVGFANRRWPHADVVDAFPAGLRARAAFQGAATAIADGSTVLAALVVAGHRRATGRGGDADSRAVALPAVGASATSQYSAAAVADDPAVQVSLAFACPIGLTDANFIGSRIRCAVAGGVWNHRAVGAAIRCEDRVALISDPARIADFAQPRILARRRPGAYG
jgi:hypothetical protein